MKAKIIHILCEGQTEQGFVNEVLKPYLLTNGVTAVKSILITTSKKKNARGGVLSCIQANNDLEIMQLSNTDNEHERHIFTTMFDLYALPNDFPKYEEAQKITDKYERVAVLEQAYADAIGSDRFIPYIQLHEFEALVFCGIDYLLELYPKCKKHCEQLKSDLDKIGNPELINDNPVTAPSKRIIRAIEGNHKTLYNYNKPATGKYITSRVGIEALRSRCHHFDKWVAQLIDC